MREPAFWHRPPSLTSRLLKPIAAIYGSIAAGRMARIGETARVPVICVGNYHVGGAGKTPTVLALVALLRGLGENPVVLSRGYGGRLRGPIVVDGSRHIARDVGDEPLMMASDVPVVVARDRVDGAAPACAQGASVIVMDDGLQNASLVKNLSLAVIDGARGVGNGSVFPAGPLRAPLAAQIARTDALIVIGEGRAADTVIEAIRARDATVFRASLKADADSVATLAEKNILAFAGIGDPGRFARTMRDAGLTLHAMRAFPDHHFYTAAEITSLQDEARRDGCVLVTTRKDAARLGSDVVQRAGIVPFGASLEFGDTKALTAFMIARLNAARSPHK